MKEKIDVHLFGHKSFLAFWGSTTLLRLASNLLQFALAIYVLDLTGSAFVYSTVLSIILLPRIFCTSLAGYLADFRDSIQILRWGTLGLTALMMGFLAIHVLVIPLNLPLIYALVICLELCETFLAPTEGKILLSIVTKEELASASKISSLDDGLVEILSPILAALFYKSVGLTGVFGAVLVLEGIAFLLAVRIRQRSDWRPEWEDAAPRVSLKHAAGAYQETIFCLKEYPYVTGIILFAPLFNFFVSPLFSVAAPHYFRVTMQADVNVYAMFNTVLGIAGLLAPFLSMVLIGDREEHRANKAGTVAAAAVLLWLSGCFYFGKDTLSATGALYGMTGAMALLVAIVTIMNIATSITIKKNVPERIMGRVLSMIQLCATISVPLGQLCYGVLIDRFPVAAACLISSLGLVFTFVVMVGTYQKINSRQ